MTQTSVSSLVHGAAIASVHMLDTYVVSKISYYSISHCRCVATCRMPKKQNIHHLLKT